MQYFKEKRIDYDSTLMRRPVHRPALNPVDHQKIPLHVVLASISFSYFETIFLPKNWTHSKLGLSWTDPWIVLVKVSWGQ